MRYIRFNGYHAKQLSVQFPNSHGRIQDRHHRAGQCGGNDQQRLDRPRAATVSNHGRDQRPVFLDGFCGWKQRQRHRSASAYQRQRGWGPRHVKSCELRYGWRLWRYRPGSIGNGRRGLGGQAASVLQGVHPGDYSPPGEHWQSGRRNRNSGSSLLREAQLYGEN